MGNCCSNPSTDSSVSPQRRGTTSEPAELVQLVVPTPPQQGQTFQKPIPGSSRPSLPHNFSRSRSANPYSDSAKTRYPPQSGIPNPPSSPLYLSKSRSANPSYDSSRNGLLQSSGAADPSPFREGHGHRHQHGAGTAPDSRPAPSALTGRPRRKNTAPFPSTVREVLPDGCRFRILVLGKSQSGKSSLINAVFNVDMAAAPGGRHGNADINVGFDPDNNRHLVVHEYSGFESGDARSLQTIGGFISHRTDANRSVSERLHAIWICVPISDAIESGLGEGVKEILGMKKVPVLIVFTKFDLLVSRVGARAHATYEGLCRSLFHEDPKDAPAVIFSEGQAYRDLIGGLTSTTHWFIKADSHDPTGRPTLSQVQLPRPLITPALLAWSIAQRVDRDIIIQASIEHVLVGRSRYWCNLGSSPDFTDVALKSCMNVIHEDIINVWNFGDRERYLLSGDFKARISHLVGDLAGLPDVSHKFSLNETFMMAQWTNGPYQNKPRNIRCIMAYIVDLTIILHGLFVSAPSVSVTKVQSAVKDYAESSSRNRIHEDIRSFVTLPVTPLTYQGKDTMMEKIIDLIKENCVLTPSQDSR